MSTQENERRSIIRSTVGGVMTDEVGAVSGDLEIATQLDIEALRASVRYAESEEWYTITGSPVSLGDRSSPSDLHERVAEHLTIPGPVVDGNEEPVSLQGFSPT
ncbi:MAG: hypothetical protein LC751_13140 [Actinobacteria bacterium]|jgi:hypothetical protein|nr:hypothetical protein [Actinomycetota bacterium]MCA1737345.1 hypothetical protein [Actinomycetota bacterium]